MKIFYAFIGIALLAGVAYAAQVATPQPKPTDKTTTTIEGSGSSTDKTKSQGASGIKGVVMLGPTCPVMRIPPDPQCNDKPYAADLAVTTVDGGRVIKQFSSDANGKFSVQVTPGIYAIRSTANVLPRCSNREDIKVTANSYTDTTVYCDTGIR